MAEDKEESAPQRGPKFVKFFGAILDALRELGGEAEPKDVYGRVKELAGVTEKELSEKNKNGRSRYENQVAWARFYLAKARLIDNKNHGRWALTGEGRETFLDHDSAIALFGEIGRRLRAVASDDDPAPSSSDNPLGVLLDDPERSFWFVGAYWNGEDKTERFVADGIWENGYYPEKFVEHVRRMKPGDRIAIKASFTRRFRLPFDNQGRSVSCMSIKAIGTIIEHSKDGQTVNVRWTSLLGAKEWYFYTYRVAIVEADVSDDLARYLIAFTFAEHEQDYDFWLRQPYWAKKYGRLPEAVSDVRREEEEDDSDIEEESFEPYDIVNITRDGCFLSESDLLVIVKELGRKKNLILQGPPGTGKTWLAKRLAYVLMGTRDRNITRKRMRVIQFHPTLSYEDFVRGWRPDGSGQLKLIDGLFLEAVDAARAERDLSFVVVIEEINRGNPAQVFGEMLTLLENDKRRADEGIELAYHREAGERVFIPDNLFVIGTMNIADRSLALVDLALRRRFAFFPLEPMLNDRWKQWCKQAGLDGSDISSIREAVTELNEEIKSDRSLGEQFRIGHSYVTPKQGERIDDARAWFRNIVESEIHPLLEEYWFDNPDQAVASKVRLLKAF